MRIPPLFPMFGWLGGFACASLWTASASAVAPEGHFIRKDGLILDAATGLTWQRVLSSATYTHDEAKAYCAGLELSGQGWRLPTIKELLTLVDETRATPAIDIRAFPGTPPEFFWTSSQAADQKDRSESVSFRFGFDGSFEHSTRQYVRCVR